MSPYPGHPVAPGPQGAPQFRPPGAPQPTSVIPGYGPTPGPPPYGPAGWPSTASRPGPAPQRPAVIAMAATMTVTASLQWICALSFFWLVSTAGAAGLSTSDTEGTLFHMLRRFHLRMVEGLALPLYGFPVLAFFLGFVILAPRAWARLALTLTGVATLAWSGWWLRSDILWWLPFATYIGIVCLILWTPGATQWYRRRAG